MNNDSKFRDISVIIPYYKGIFELRELCGRLTDTLSSISNNWQVIFVDDRSPDNGWALIKELAEDDNRICGLRLSRNFGQHAAITAGIYAAQSNWYVVMDCDLQDRPEDVALLFKKAVECQHNIVIAERANATSGLRRSYSSIIFNRFFSWLSGLNSNESIGNFRIFSYKVAEAYRQFPEQFRYFPALMAELGFAPVLLKLPRDERLVSTSSYTFVKLLALAFDAIISYSDKPLLITAGASAATVCLSVVLATYYLGAYIFLPDRVDGFTTLVLALLCFGGLQVFLISIVGLYVGRVLRESKRRPLFLIQEKTF